MENFENYQQTITFKVVFLIQRSLKKFPFVHKCLSRVFRSLLKFYKIIKYNPPFIIKKLKLSNGTKILKLQEGNYTFDPHKENVLVVSHEASRTGAPILTWNICKELCSKYNVFIMLLTPGTLENVFKEVTTKVCGPYNISLLDTIKSQAIINELCKAYAFKFSIVNSIVSKPVLQPLAENFVPSILLIHEFLAYTPHFHFNQALLWASSVVFSSTITQKNAINDTTQASIKLSQVIPQGKSIIPFDGKTQNNNNTLANYINGFETKPFIVLGAGTVEYRKGLDLFIATAGEIKRLNPSANILMLWIGKGYAPESGNLYSAFLSEQIENLKDFNNFKLFQEVSNLEEIYQHIQVLFLSSRLDPLPNVAIDAMAQGKPVLSFENATGINDFLIKEPETAGFILPYMNIHAAAEKILQLYNSEVYYSKISTLNKQIAATYFEMNHYVSKLGELAKSAILDTAQIKDDYNTLIESQAFVKNYYWPNYLPVILENEAIKHYLNSWKSQIHLRKPAPGFLPHIYARLNNLQRNVNPFAHYIRSGKPKGKWQQELIVPEAQLNNIQNVKIAVHIHVFYPDLFNVILARLLQNNIAFDCFISVPSDEIKTTVQNLIPKTFSGRCVIQKVPNIGRDIAPFLTEFGNELQSYDIIGHFHTKKSLELKSAAFSEAWMNFLLENLIAGKKQLMFKQIVGEFIKDTSLGLVFADDPHLIGWNKNKKFAEQLIQTLPKTYILPEDDFNFPIGTMFWARPKAIQPLFDLNLTWDDYPEEPLPYDGTMLHAIERLLPFIVEQENFTQKTTFIPGITR